MVNETLYISNSFWINADEWLIYGITYDAVNVCRFQWNKSEGKSYCYSIIVRNQKDIPDYKLNRW